MSQIVLTISEDDIERLIQRAYENGYESVEDYLRALVEAELYEDSLDHIRSSIKQGAKEAFRGDVVPLESLWTDDEMSDFPSVMHRQAH